MIKNVEVAARVSDTMKRMFELLDASVADVQEHCSEEEYKAYLKSTSSIAGGIVMDVMEPLYDKHPELAPSYWNDK